MREIIFLDEPYKYFDESEFIAHLPEAHGEDELSKKLSEVLKFPDYFEGNWNAVYDCLCDFHWIAEKGVVLIHKEIPDLIDEKMKIYLEVLLDAVESWSQGEEHYFKVIFPETARLKLEEVTLIFNIKNDCY